MRYLNLLFALFFGASILSAAHDFIVIPVPYQDPLLDINAFWASNLNRPGIEARQYNEAFMNARDRLPSSQSRINGLFWEYPWQIPSANWCAKRRFVAYELDYLCSETLQKVRNAIGD